VRHRRSNRLTSTLTVVQLVDQPPAHGQGPKRCGIKACRGFKSHLSTRG